MGERMRGQLPLHKDLLSWNIAIVVIQSRFISRLLSQIRRVNAVSIKKAFELRPRASQSSQWYESNRVWGAGGISLAIVLTVVAAMKKDLRWMLALAWPFAMLAVWMVTVELNRKTPRVILRIIAAIVLALGLYGLSVWLRPVPFPTVSASAVPGTAASVRPGLGGQIDMVAVAPFWLNKNDSVVTLEATITNSASPSVANSFTMRIKTKEGQLMNADGILPAADEPTILRDDRGRALRKFEPSEFLPQRVESQAIPTGGAASGFFQAVAHGLKRDQISQAGVVIYLDFKDVLGNTVEASYAMSGKPMKWLEPQPSVKLPGANGTVRAPVFSEGPQDSVVFNLGAGQQNVELSRLTNGQKFQPLNFAPVYVYIDGNGVLSVDADFYSGPVPVLVIRHNQIIHKGPLPGWDMNSDARAIEIIGPSELPVFQLAHNGSVSIDIKGIFETPSGPIFVIDDRGLRVERPGSNPAFNGMKLFQYPSEYHKGERAR